LGFDPSSHFIKAIFDVFNKSEIFSETSVLVSTKTQNENSKLKSQAF
jgi:hypothetical protein